MNNGYWINTEKFNIIVQSKNMGYINTVRVTY